MAGGAPQLMGLGRVPAEYRELLSEYCAALQSHFGERLRSICLFGSIARGEATGESDMDLLVVADGLPDCMGFRGGESTRLFLRVREGEAYRSLRRGGRSGFASPVILKPEEAERHPSILLDIVEDGIILYDRDAFLQRVLGDIRRRLAELGARRVKTQKGRYWILKADMKPGEDVEI